MANRNDMLEYPDTDMKRIWMRLHDNTDKVQQHQARHAFMNSSPSIAQNSIVTDGSAADCSCNPNGKGHRAAAGA